ncbi:hypothetical protein SAMN05660964_01926 [Thiothrix caldifontis]|uniref:Uncharacterized protein n=2 Tax=Thiothrix caldifontis TaxID=525918 RepID=A0A1H4CFK8_9GAMM|nr:hypothetical protein SAMN05660964_01926 [Thiothrix caldifontis]
MKRAYAIRPYEDRTCRGVLHTPSSGVQHEDTAMQSRLLKLLHKLHHRTQQVDPALKRAYPGLPSYLLKRHSALLSMTLEGHRHG